MVLVERCRQPHHAVPTIPAPEEDSNSFLNHKLGDMKITLFKIISCFFLQIEKVEAREVK
jgi:hypothetical protein